MKVGRARVSGRVPLHGRYAAHEFSGKAAGLVCKAALPNVAAAPSPLTLEPPQILDPELEPSSTPSLQDDEYCGATGVISPSMRGERMLHAKLHTRSDILLEVCTLSVRIADWRWCTMPCRSTARLREAREAGLVASTKNRAEVGTAQSTLHHHAGSVMDRNAPAESSGRKFFIHTFGCQMNLADSERMAGALEAAGYQCTPEAKDANVLVYNTCSIREKAENKVYSALGRQAQRKRQHFNDLKIVVAGCVAQQEGQRLLRRVPEVDIVMGPQHANQIASLLDQADDGQVRRRA